MDIKRRENESYLSYAKRITEDRKELDLDYSEWSKLLIGKDYSSDNARKAFYILQPFIEKLESEKVEDITSEDILNELELKRIEVEKERKKRQSINIEYNKLIREQARKELQFDFIKECAAKIEIPNFKDLTIHKNGRKEAVLGISDFHFGKIFKSINNEYSEEIFYERMNKLACEVKELCVEHKISKLHIVNAGDDVEGMALRVSQLRSLQSGFIEQVTKLSRYMAKFLNKVSENVQVVYHHVLEGNHSELRSLGDRTFTYENMERFIVTYLQDVLVSNPRITIPWYDKNYALFNILGYNIYARHGHKVKQPKTIIQKASQQVGKQINIAYLGHLHHSEEFTVGSYKNTDLEVIYLPSIMGEDEYCDDFYFGGACASAKFDIYEEGKCRKFSEKIILN